MVKAELKMLADLMDKFKDTLQQFDENGDSELLYNLVAKAEALYGEEEPQIIAAVETINQYSGTLKRESEVILLLLERKYVMEENGYQSGIMAFTLENLSVSPKAQNVYRSGIQKYSAGKHERNILDDMRLSLELLLKQFLGNDKSLENQMPILGSRLDGFGISPEVRNLIRIDIDYLCKYQNHFVKHSDAVNPVEINYVIEQISSVINLIVKLM